MSPTTLKLLSPADLTAAINPLTISKDGMNVVPAETLACNASANVILYLSAPGAVKFGVSVELS